MKSDLKLIGKALILYLLVISIFFIGCQKPIEKPLGAGLVSTGAYIVIQKHPFATGPITTDSSQNSSIVSSQSTNMTSYTNVEVVKITAPVGYILDELEVSLIGKVISSNASSLVWYRWAISDDNVSWQPLGMNTYSGNLTGTTSVNTTSWATTYPYMGRYGFPAGNFTGAKDVFYLAFQISASQSTCNCSGMAKNSSYIIATYRAR